jgi:8-oxo-dGTP pyrophosphatase MutT (NUDIX family)
MEILPYTRNAFSGGLCDPAELPNDVGEFEARLTTSLEAWADEGLKVIWLEIPIDRSALIPVAVQAGFAFHHTGSDYLMLIRRLEEGAFVPPYATHYVGAGGVVLRDGTDVLVVSERHRRSKTPYYKLPGGALHPGENLVDGVRREVLEETGIDTEYEALVCFRHWHGYRHGKSDIYFISRLKPLNHDVTIQEEEIEDSFWMPVGEYLHSDRVHTFNRVIVRAALESPGIAPSFVDGYSDSGREVFLPVGLEVS